VSLQTLGRLEEPVDLAALIFHEVLDRPFMGLPSKHFVFFWITSILVLVLARLALRSYRGHVPHGVGTLVETFVVFVRDEVAVGSIGEEGRRFTPLLLSFFFLILIAALVGLLPFAAASTGNLAVTMALAVVSFGAQQWAGISRHGVRGHLRHLVPPGLPTWLLPLVVPVEVLGMFAKPFALMVRLFANMLAGHMVVTTLLLLIPTLAAVRPAFGWAAVPVSLSLALHDAARDPGRLHPGVHLHPADGPVHRNVRTACPLM